MMRRRHHAWKTNSGNGEQDDVANLVRRRARFQRARRVRVRGAFCLRPDGEREFHQRACFLIEWSGLMHCRAELVVSLRDGGIFFLKLLIRFW